MNARTTLLPLLLTPAATLAQGALTTIAPTTGPLATDATSALCLENGALQVVWEDSGLLLHSSSTDTGSTWSAPVLLDAQASQPTVHQLFGGTLAIVYRIDTYDSYEVRVVESADLGSTWSQPTTLHAGAAGARSTQLSCSSGSLHLGVAWNEDGALLYTQSFLGNWLAAPVLVSTDVAANPEIALELRTADNSGAAATLAWQDANGGVACATFAALGNAPAFDVVSLSQPGRACSQIVVGQAPDDLASRLQRSVAWLETSGSRRAAVVAGCNWQPANRANWSLATVHDNSNGAPGPDQIAFAQCFRMLLQQAVATLAYTADGAVYAHRIEFPLGAVRVGPARRLDTSKPRGVDYTDQLVVEARSTQVLVGWRSGPAGNKRLFADRSRDRGATWIGAAEISGAAQPTSQPAGLFFHGITGRNDAVREFAYWTSSSGLRSRLLRGSLHYGEGTGALPCELRDRSAPGSALGGDVVYEVTGTPAPSQLAVFVLGTGRGPIDAGTLLPGCAGTDLNIGSVDVQSVVFADGGLASLAFSVPRATALAGARVHVTAALANGAATGCGLDVSNGIETWIW